jgi:hypothetical protein
MVVAFVSIAPWLVALAWIVRRHGLRMLIPRDDVPVSFGELARRRTASP